jgi:hypothetical protein
VKSRRSSRRGITLRNGALMRPRRLRRRGSILQ